MRNKLQTMIWALVLLPQLVVGAVTSQIVETNRFADILQHVKPNTLVLLDIDNTLIEPVQTLGSDQWFTWRVGYYQKQGYEGSAAVEQALTDWMPAISLTKVKLVEPQTAALVKRLQDEGFVVMGLTTRSAILNTATLRQLGSVEIDLTRTAPSQGEFIFLNPHEVIFKEGILFTSGTDKGRALFHLLGQIEGEFPKGIIAEVLFINDKQSNLEDVQRACDERGIPYVGLRYGYLDEKVHNFSEEAAEQAFQRFVGAL